MAKIVVTGGAGFIGSHILQELAADHTLAVIDDLSSGKLENIQSKVDFQKFDIRSGEARDYLKRTQPDILVHAAAQMSVRQSMEDPAFDTHVNVFGLINLLQAFADGVKPYVVFISTGGAIYGEQDVFPANEKHAIRPASVYGLAKYVGELYLDLWARQFSLEYCALRLANVYGPRQSPHGEAGVIAIFYDKLFRGLAPVINGAGSQTRDFVYVKDVAAAVKRCIDSRVRGVYNIGTGIETSINDLYELIRESAGVNIQAEHGAAKAGEQQRSSIDNRKAFEDFKWAPTVTLSDGLKLTAQYFRPL